jgi:hypothetical protein
MGFEGVKKVTDEQYRRLFSKIGAHLTQADPDSRSVMASGLVLTDPVTTEESASRKRPQRRIRVCVTLILA